MISVLDPVPPGPACGSVSGLARPLSPADDLVYK